MYQRKKLTIDLITNDTIRGGQEKFLISPIPDSRKFSTNHTLHKTVTMTHTARKNQSILGRLKTTQVYWFI